MEPRDLIVLTPSGAADPSLAIAACRAGAWGVLDLEHASCYAPKDGWVALMDERYKYIYFEHTGQQQLFDLSRDPQELINLADKPGAAKLLKQWRQKMIKHLSVRGEPWVRDGDLVVQTTPVRRRANNPIVMR